MTCIPFNVINYYAFNRLNLEKQPDLATGKLQKTNQNSFEQNLLLELFLV